MTSGMDGGDGRRLLARVRDLRLHFETKRGVVKALDGVSFDIYEGETLALVGETGCGKSITARSFMQLVPTPPGFYPDGEVLFRSERECTECGGTGCEGCHDTGYEFENLLDVSPSQMQHMRGTRIAMVFQDPGTALNPSLTIQNQVAESILVHDAEEILVEAGVPPGKIDSLQYGVLRAHTSAEQTPIKSTIAKLPPLRRHKLEIDRIVHERVVDVLRKTQIPSPEEVTSKYPHELSGGMQQRVMISMALVAEPDLLIADEPTTALDVTIQSKILNLMDDLQSEFNTSLLYITHDLTLVKQISDTVAVMYAGAIAELAGVNDLYSNPLHPYTWGLLDSIPTEERMNENLRGISGTIPDLTNPPEGCRFCTRCPEELDHCAAVEPEFSEEESNHYVACHLYPVDGGVTTSDDASRPVSTTND